MTSTKHALTFNLLVGMIVRIPTTILALHFSHLWWNEEKLKGVDGCAEKQWSSTNKSFWSLESTTST
jgi:hypothetical protein